MIRTVRTPRGQNRSCSAAAWLGQFYDREAKTQRAGVPVSLESSSRYPESIVRELSFGFRFLSQAVAGTRIAHRASRKRIQGRSVVLIFGKRPAIEFLLHCSFSSHPRREDCPMRMWFLAGGRLPGRLRAGSTFQIYIHGGSTFRDIPYPKQQCTFQIERVCMR